ncbi:hypothetical protein FACS189450_01530 [Spirochaetia bacterium]|nr:hypothetical protein FACS189450_01530 [Spirochaetia bacterium]
MELSAGEPVNVAYSATTARVTFTGAMGLSLAAADFTVTTGGTIGTPAVSGNTVTVPVTFAANTGTSTKTYTVGINSGSAKIKGGATVVITQAVGPSIDTRVELSAGSAVDVVYTATTTSVTFTGAMGLSLTAADFTVTTGGTIGTPAVSGDAVTVPVTFAANTDPSTKTYTVGINSGSAKIKGGATVVITQAAAPAGDTRVELSAGSTVNAAYTATTASVTFTGATGLSLTAADFTVTTGGTIGTPAVSSDAVTVPITFAANTDPSTKTYTVGINGASTKIKGEATVVITQEAGTDLGLYIGTAASPQPNTSTLDRAMAWLKTNAASDTNYTILIGTDGNLPPWTLGGTSPEWEVAANGKTGVKITLKGKDAERRVQINGTGSLFTIKSGVTLVLDENITLVGRSTNNVALVVVENSGRFEMRENAKITGNTGGGVKVVSRRATFTMYDSASVSGNTTSHVGGGVYINGDGWSNATFTMYGNASVSGNTSFSGGGGVYVTQNATFTMNDSASVSGNTINTSHVSLGGGVYVQNATFTMNGNASVSGNTATTTATASSQTQGGGVFVADGTFTMNDSATVSGNTASPSSSSSSSDSWQFSGGGGVYVQNATFTMNDSATVSGNTASPSGGGVYVYDGIFTMKGGTVYGSDGGANANKLEGSGTKEGVSFYKDTGSSTRAIYGDSQPIIAGTQSQALYTDDTLTGHN